MVAGRLARALRQADWLDADRALAYGRLLWAAVLVFGLAAQGKILLAALSDPAGRPIASDFDPFWSGARLAVQGRPALAYDAGTIQRMENTGAQLGQRSFPYLYPPVWMLLCLPLGLLPYAVALMAFLVTGYAAFAACLRALLPRRWPLLSVLAFPAAVLNATIGQNGFVSATCFAGAALLLDRRPALGGACLGLLAYKPQLAIGVPVWLLLAGRWRALVFCAATAVSLVVLSWAVLGTEAWQGFCVAAPSIRAVLYNFEVWPKLISVFTAVRLLGGPAPLATVAQGAVGLCVLACVAAVACRRPGAQAETATMVAATMLFTPYLMDYDLVCLAVPMAWLAARATATGWYGWEKIVLAASLLMPLGARACNLVAGVPLAPPVLAALLAVVVARVVKEGKAFLSEEKKQKTLTSTVTELPTGARR